jgi:hypothetical protein
MSLPNSLAARGRLLPLLACIVLAPADALRAQGVEWRAPALRVEVDAIGSGAYLTDGNGLEVRAEVAPALSLAAAWRSGHLYGVELFGRGSNAGVDVSESGTHWSAGHARQLDLGAALERRFGDRFTVRAGGGASWISGPADVAPFRFMSSGAPHPSAEAGGSVRLLRTRPLAGVITFQGVRYGGAAVTDPAGGSGWVMRLLGGVRYGR